MAKHDLLIEIGTEEIPARFVEGAGEQLERKLTEWLDEQRIRYEDSTWYGTPRRFAALVYGVADKQAEKNEEVRGPSKQIAVDEAGVWTKAALGFARGQGVAPDALIVREYKGKPYIFARKQQQGRPTEALLRSELASIITNLSFPVNMRWGHNDLRYVRPIRWLVSLYGVEVIPIEIAGVAAGDVTRGHRFLGDRMTIGHAADYLEVLRRQYVIADQKERRKMIREQLTQLAEAKQWCIPIDEKLLDEVTYLVEYPTTVWGSFDPAFLDIPHDVLITSMREHQRYFPVRSQGGRLLNHFVTIRNGDDTAVATVAKGNEKVIHARLADARFFYEEDQKHSLDYYQEKLADVVFHEQLGTIADKVWRVRAITRQLTRQLAFNEHDKARANRTAELCKFDLVTQMVNEFPELQGHMGEEYARVAGEDTTVARAIYEHYLPRNAGDTLPSTEAGVAVSLADKTDTIVACFGIGIIPTGSQDPYALRRQAAGITQILLESNHRITLQLLLGAALDGLDSSDLLQRPRQAVTQQLMAFFASRLKHIMQRRHMRYDVVDAVLHSGVDNPKLVVSKAAQLMTETEKPAFKKTTEAFTRIHNLAVKSNEEPVHHDEALHDDPAEKQLWHVYQVAAQQFEEAFENEQVDLMFQSIAGMEDAIRSFFDNVMVMVDATEIRRNRLALLQTVSDLIHRFAHFEYLVLS